MKTILSILGFTTLKSTLWSSAAYIAVVGIIVALFVEKNDRLRYILFAVGGAVLGVYSALFLHDVLFTVLQIVVVCSALFQLFEIKQRRAQILLGFLTAGAIIFLVYSGNLNDAWGIVGAIGFLGLAAGIIMLPHYVAFPIMAVGGALLVGYAWETTAWAFFALNIAFVISNIIQWYRNKPLPATR